MMRATTRQKKGALSRRNSVRTTLCLAFLTGFLFVSPSFSQPPDPSQIPEPQIACALHASFAPDPTASNPFATEPKSLKATELTPVTVQGTLKGYFLSPDGTLSVQEVPFTVNGALSASLPPSPLPSLGRLLPSSHYPVF